MRYQIVYFGKKSPFSKEFDLKGGFRANAFSEKVFENLRKVFIKNWFNLECMRQSVQERTK